MVLNKSFRVFRRWRPTRSVLLECRNTPEESLLFESGTLNVLTPAEADYVRKEYPDVDTAYACLGVLQGEGILYLVLVTGCLLAGRIGTTEVYRITKTSLIPLHSSAHQSEAVLEMGKLLACGQFYFSIGEGGATEGGGGGNGGGGGGFRLMSRAQKTGQDDSQFLWNRSLYVYLQRFGISCSKWLIPIMCGSVCVQTVYAGNKQVKACLVSRMSCERTGTRFNVRGLDDDGQVANFVETEQVMYVDDCVASFVQIRGLVPIFWDQPGIQTGTNRIRLSRGYHSTHPAFERHYERLLKEYGPSLSLNLLGKRDMEPLLTEAFQDHISELSLPGATQYIHFDYHSHCRPGHMEALESILLPQCDEFLERCGYYLERGGAVEKGQMGVVRHNCLDCLDRSNNAQALLGITVLQQQLQDMGVVLRGPILMRFMEQYKSFWIQNGDNISRFYAGTKALDGTSKVAKVRDRVRSVQRTLKNNFMDSSKQEAIDVLLLNGYQGELGWRTRALLSAVDSLAPLPVRRRCCDRWLQFTKPEKIKVSVGTWNVNGGKHIQSVALKNQSLHDWLLDAPTLSKQGQEHPEDFATPADIFAIGFQELVGLTASNLLSTSSSNRHVWAAELQRVLSRDTPYSLLTAEQLVGVCLYIFVKPHLLPFVRDVAVSSVKTGIGGAAGNKGGVAIRLLLHSTSLCFVCSHFAAHQNKVAERNNDFAEICRKVQFPLGQTIQDQDYVFWCGDLNYRIDLPGPLAKDSIGKGEWQKLHRHEQLIKQRKLGKVFRGYSEGLLDFAPTFKYDMFSCDYDTSEKARVPAWCDRILWRRRSFLPPSKHQVIARLRGDDDYAGSVNGEYGWHVSTVQKVCERELSSRDNALQWWHPGRLLYYGRTELLTSDHRPVLGVFDIDVFRVSEGDRKLTMMETLRDLGPPDATVIVKPASEQTNYVDNTKLVQCLQQYGRIVLVRSNDENTLVTFNSPEAALTAVDKADRMIDDVPITLELKQSGYRFGGSSAFNILTGVLLAKLTNVEDEEEEEGAGLEGEESDVELDMEEEEELGIEGEEELEMKDKGAWQGNHVTSNSSIEDPSDQLKPSRPALPPPNRPRPPINRPPPPAITPNTVTPVTSPHPPNDDNSQDNTNNESSPITTPTPKPRVSPVPKPRSASIRAPPTRPPPTHRKPTSDVPPGRPVCPPRPSSSKSNINGTNATPTTNPAPPPHRPAPPKVPKRPPPPYVTLYPSTEDLPVDTPPEPLDT